MSRQHNAVGEKQWSRVKRLAQKLGVSKAEARRRLRERPVAESRRG